MGMIIGGLLGIVISVAFITFGAIDLHNDFISRIPKNDQKIATECYVNEKVKQPEERKWTGYIIGTYYAGNGFVPLKNSHLDAEILEELDDKYKVGYKYSAGSYSFKWLPKSEFYKYPSRSDLAVMFKEFEKKKKKD